MILVISYAKGGESDKAKRNGHDRLGLNISLILGLVLIWITSMILQRVD